MTTAHIVPTSHACTQKETRTFARAGGFESGLTSTEVVPQCKKSAAEAGSITIVLSGDDDANHSSHMSSTYRRYSRFECSMQADPSRPAV